MPRHDAPAYLGEHDQEKDHPAPGDRAERDRRYDPRRRHEDVEHAHDGGTPPLSVARHRHQSGTETTGGGDTAQDRWLRLLGALIYAELAGVPSVKETKPGHLAVRYPEGDEWTVHIDKTKIRLTGSPHSPNMVQLAGEIDEDSEIGDLIEAAENIKILIQDAQDVQPPSPPVDYPGMGGEDEGADAAESGGGGGDVLTPAPGAAPPTDPLGGDADMLGQGGANPLGAPPPGGLGLPPGGGAPGGGMPPGMGGPPGGMMDPSMGMGMGGGPPGMGAPGGFGMPPSNNVGAGGGMMPQSPPPQPQFPPAGMPTASRRGVRRAGAGSGSLREEALHDLLSRMRALSYWDDGGKVGIGDPGELRWWQADPAGEFVRVAGPGVAPPTARRFHVEQLGPGSVHVTPMDRSAARRGRPTIGAGDRGPAAVPGWPPADPDPGKKALHQLLRHWKKTEYIQDGIKVGLDDGAGGLFWFAIHPESGKYAMIVGPKKPSSLAEKRRIGSGQDPLVAHLDRVADELQRVGAARWAARVDRVTNDIEGEGGA